MVTQPPPVPLTPRSGDQVINTMTIVGLLVSLLSPFIAAALTWTENNTAIAFTEGYQSQLESAVGLGIMYIAAVFHMRVIRQREPPAEQTDTVEAHQVRAEEHKS